MTLQVHLSAELIQNSVDGDVVAAIPDKSDWQRWALQPTVGNRGTYWSKAVSGRPGVLLDGAGQNYELGGALSYYQSASAFSILCACKVFPESNDGTTYTNDSIFNFGGYLGLYTRVSGGSGTLYGYYFDTAGQEVSRTFVPGDVLVIHFYKSGGSIYLSVNGGAYDSTPVGAIGSTTVSSVFGVDHILVHYMRMFFCEFKMEDAVPSDIANQYLAMQRKYQKITSSVYLNAQDVGSRIIRARRCSKTKTGIDIPLWYGADLIQGSRVWIQHKDLPHSAGSGAKTIPWDLFRAVVLRKTLNLNNNLVNIMIRDSIRVSFWFVPSGVIDPNLGRGVCLLLSGQTITHTRASTVIVAYPNGNKVELPVDAPGFDANGLLCESASTNLIVNPIFASGTTGWTLGGAGTASLDTTDLDFDGSLSKNSLKMIADNPLVSGKTASQTVAVLANETVTVSLIRKDGVAAYKVLIQRSVDNWYWTGTAWQSGSAYITLTLSTTRARVMLDPIPVGGSNTNLLVQVSAVTTAAQQNYLYHLQVEKKNWASSPIIGYSTTLTNSRAATSYLITNNSSAPAFCPLHGTGQIGIKFNFNSSQVSGKTFGIFRIPHDGSNEWKLEYNGTTGQFVLTMISAGNTVTATVTQAIVRGTEVLLAWRWIGTEGELGLSPFRVDIFANGVIGTGAVNTALPTQAASCNIELGSASGNYLEGTITRLFLSPDVLTDARIETGVD